MSDVIDRSTTERSPADRRPGSLPDLDLASVEIPAQTFFQIAPPTQLAETLRLRLTEQCYLPKASDPLKDWIARVACPAFQNYRRRRPLAAERLERFCTIGTGAGLDALVAAEILRPGLIAVTDLHRDVVDQAMSNILANLKTPERLVLRSGVGDLLAPFQNSQLRFDLIYENLPNIPLPDGVSLDDGQASSSFIAARGESVPALAQSYLMDLHYAFLLQAHRFLNPDGAVLSSIGGRLPLQAMLQTFAAAGYDAEIILYSWKIQSEPDEVITGYAEAQQAGHGPFHFYLAEDLAAFFAKQPEITGNAGAEVLEKQLRPKQIDAATALALHRQGKTIGHTVAVIEGRPKKAA